MRSIIMPRYKRSASDRASPGSVAGSTDPSSRSTRMGCPNELSSGAGVGAKASVTTNLSVSQDVRDGISLSAGRLRFGVSARADARVVGYLAVSVAAVLYGLWANLSKLVEASVPPLTIALYTQFLPGLLYVPAVARHGFPRNDVRLLLLISGAGAVAAPVVYYYGLVGTTASNAALLSNSEAVFTVVIAFLFLGERLTIRGYAAMVGVVLGALIVTTELRV